MRGIGAANLRGVSARRVLRDGQPSFSGGLNTTAADTELAVNQCRTCTNGILSQFGDVTKRLGTRRLHSAAIVASTPIRNGFCWRTATTHEYLAAVNNRLYSGGTYSTAMTWTDKGAITAGTVYPIFSAFRDGAGEAAYIADGTLRKYTGGVLSAPAGATGVNILEVYNQRLFGVTGSDQTLYYSALNNGDSLGNAGAGGGSAIIRTFSAQKITGLLNLRNSLAIFHVSGVSRFTGYTQDDIAIGAGTQGISTDVGTIAPRSMIAVDGLGFFLSERGAYMITDEGVRRIDSPASPDPTVPLMTSLAIADFAAMDVVYDKATKTIRWTIPGVGIYLYHIPLNAWSGPWTGGYLDTVTYCLFDGIDSSGRPITLKGGADGFLNHCDYTATYKDNVLSDASGGTSYTLAVQLHRMYTRSQEAEKAWRWAYLFGDLRGTISASVSWATETGVGTYTLPNISAGSSWGSFTWGAFSWGGTGSRPFRIPISGRGTYIDISIGDDGNAASIYSRLSVEGFDYGSRG